MTRSVSKLLLKKEKKVLGKQALGCKQNAAISNKLIGQDRHDSDPLYNYEIPNRRFTTL